MSEDQKIWFLYLVDHHEGPFALSEVAEKITQGSVSGKTLSWKDGMAEWVELETISELKGLLSVEEKSAEPSLAAMLAASQGSADEAAPDTGASLSLEIDEKSIKLDIGGDSSPAPAASATPKPLNKSTLSSIIKSSGTKPIAIASAPKQGPVLAPAIDDEKTDPSIAIPQGTVTKKSKVSFFEKMKDIFARKKSESIKKPVKAAVQPAKKVGGKSMGGMVKRIAIILFVLLILGGGGGAGYWFFLKSPIPDMDDVRRDDYEKFVVVAKSSLRDGVKFHHAIAVGDDVTPTIYVASNLPENTVINISLSGIPGTLVNALEAEAKFNAPLMKTKLATFGPLKIDGKPLPMGEYKMAIYTDGGERIDLSIFLGGKKGPIYERRMAQYKEKLQTTYDPEVLELRELVQTTHAVFDEFFKKITEVRTMMPTVPAKKANAIASWKQYGVNLGKFIGGMDQKIKDKLAAAQAAGQEKFYPYVYKDIQSLLAQILQVYAQQSAAIESATPPVPPGTPDPLQQMQLMLQGFDKVMAEAATKSPLDALLLKLQVAKTAPAAAAPVASPVPVNPVSGSPVVPAAPSPVK